MVKGQPWFVLTLSSPTGVCFFYAWGIRCGHDCKQHIINDPHCPIKFRTMKLWSTQTQQCQTCLVVSWSIPRFSLTMRAHGNRNLYVRRAMKMSLRFRVSFCTRINSSRKSCVLCCSAGWEKRISRQSKDNQLIFQDSCGKLIEKEKRTAFCPPPMGHMRKNPGTEKRTAFCPVFKSQKRLLPTTVVTLFVPPGSLWDRRVMGQCHPISPLPWTPPGSTWYGAFRRLKKSLASFTSRDFQKARLDLS